MKCPFEDCEDESFPDVEILFWHLHDKHSANSVAFRLAEMIAADMIPRIKVEAKIKELKKEYSDISKEMYATHFTSRIENKIEIGCHPVVIKILKELL